MVGLEYRLKIIKRLFYRNRTILHSVVICMGSCKTFKSKHLLESDIGRLQDSLLVDREGNNYSVKELLDNNYWMTSNLNINIPGSYGYENAEQTSNQYGRLYMWKATPEECKLLEEGWRLPTNEELQNMAKWYEACAVIRMMMVRQLIRR